MNTLALDPSKKRQSNFTLPYHSLRNISCPDDISNNRKTLAGHVAAKHTLEISTNENVRTYLLEAEGKKRKVPTAVHRAIRETLENSPEKFSVLNGGLTIVCSSYSVDEKNKVLTLVNPSIINGAQTQGILRDYYNSLDNPEIDFPDIHISYQLIVTEDAPLVAEISIARNFQNDVKLLSISGKLSYLDELSERIEKELNLKIKRSETDVSDAYIDTEKLLQVLTAFIPESLWTELGRGELSNKTYAYNQKAKCLKEFIELKKALKSNPTKAQSELYQLFLDIAPLAWTVYSKWKVHEGFRGTALRCIQREGKNIVDVPDGIVFPIIASLSAFVVKKDGVWTLDIPEIFRDEDLIQAAKSTYMEIAGSKPYVMGRSKASYSSLSQVTSIYKRLISAQQ
ncbi:AIPR family protein [Vibrio parahaemolyticus]|uniref:AIPR family protein n=1 Tax=Vibrio diabolicus TaxID=50719 RepID=UPI0028082D66|nr:hypothetical protein [Vibrio alginolyticus]ELA8199608.1 AIPR family protein [Vibrio parahaemolyticus]HCH4900160.1 AIPR family protein [Vibrio parahaemolyticus]